MQAWVPDASMHGLHATDDIQVSLETQAAKNSGQKRKRSIWGQDGGTWSWGEFQHHGQAVCDPSRLLTAHAQAEGATVCLRRWEGILLQQVG